MKLEIPWRLVAGAAFVAAFIAIGGVGTLIWQVNRIVEYQEAYNQIVLDCRMDVRNFEQDIQGLHIRIQRLRQEPVQWKLRDGQLAPDWVAHHENP